MAAPTKAANVKKVLANSEPSTHGTKQTFQLASRMFAFGGKADMPWTQSDTFCRGRRVAALRPALSHYRTINCQFSSPPPEVFLQILASLFVRDLEHFLGRGYLVAIVYSPNERYVLVHGHCSDPKSLCGALQAQRMPSAEASFRNLILNQRVDTTMQFIDMRSCAARLSFCCRGCAACRVTPASILPPRRSGCPCVGVCR